MASTHSATPGGRSPFGEILLNLRTARGFTQEQLANAIQSGRISPRSITNYERAVKDPREWVLPHRPVLRLLAQALELDAVDHHHLVTAWLTTRNTRGPHEDRTNAPTSSAFVTAGREQAVEHLTKTWDMAKNGTPQIVMLGGISGVGKTSLLRYLSDHVAASTNEVLISWGGSSSWASAVEPYLAIRTATDRLLMEPSTSSTLPGNYPNRPKLENKHIQMVKDVFPLLGGALISDRTVRSLLTQHGDADSGMIDLLLSERSNTDTAGRQEEFSRMLIEFSQSWPILIVLEDLHWSGEATAGLILHLAKTLQQQRDTPIMVVCTYRSNEVFATDGTPPSPMERLLGSLGYAANISRIQINDSMSRELGLAFLHGVLERTPMQRPEDTDDLAQVLYEQTSGHPLLTMELIRHLQESQAIAPVEGTDFWTFDRTKISDNLPQAVSTFVGQRLNRVSRQGRRILDIAAVMDSIVLTDVISAVLDVPEEQVIEIIENELVEIHRLLLEGPMVRMQNRLQESYLFPHALIREHIYSSLSETRRRRLHRSIADNMERAATNADSITLSEITSHYVLAEDWHSAQIAGYRLAQDASSRLDWDLASTWFDQAEDLALKAQDPQQLWRARAARLAVLRGLGEFDDGIELGGRILHLASIHNWPQTLALANHHLGEIYYDLGEVDNAVECLQRAIALHAEYEQHDLAAAGEAMISHATYRQGKYDVSHKHAQLSLQHSRQLKNSWVQPEAVLALANCESDLGFHEQAIENYELAIELAVMIGKLSNQFIPVMNIALCHIQMGKHKRAREDLLELIDRLKSQRLFRLSTFAVHYLGMAYEGEGNLDAAAETFALATHMRLERGRIPVMFDSIAGQLRVATLQGNMTLAETYLQQITEQLEEHGWEGMEDPLLVHLSVATSYLALDNPERYRAHINEAHELLMARASMIEDETSRTSYLTNMPVNVELQARFAQL